VKLARRTPITLRRQIADLRDEVDDLTAKRDRLLRNVALAERTTSPTTTPPPDDSVYVFDEDADEARAFDDFYRAYDDGHAKTRKFLLG
jgi:hypothetical protein